MAASRLKGKPLLEINNVPIICHVLNKAKETGLEAIVATEDKEIVTAIEQNGGGKVMLTGSHKTGTDRIFEALQKINISNIELVMNLQGDEPLIDINDIRYLKSQMIKSRSKLGTLASKISNKELYENQNIVKVITKEDLNNFNFPEAKNFMRKVSNKTQNIYHHLGIYCYQREMLKKFIYCTVITTVLFIIIYLLMKFEYLNLRNIIS